jgi:DNA-binding LacI/PurR family transcriptional regulator
MAKKITIRDVARMAGVSISSVSRYLADPKTVLPLAAYNIRNAVLELGYEPNLFARNLKRGYSNTVGIVVPHMEFFFSKACAAMGDFFYERKYVTFICESANDPAKERFYVQELLSHKVAGLIIAPGGLNTDYLREIAKKHKNMVILDRNEDIGCAVVAADHEENAYRLLSFVLENRPCDRIGLLLGQEAAYSTRACRRGVERAMADHKTDPSRVRMFFGCRKMENVSRAVGELCRNPKGNTRPSVVAFAVNFLEYAVMSLNRLGPGALKKVDLAGFALQNSMDMLGINCPCVILNPEETGITAARLLYDMILSPDKQRDSTLPVFHEVKCAFLFAPGGLYP